ncbi:hypothetical protein ACL02S_01400 [Nocardia sp. 004]
MGRRVYPPEFRRKVTDLVEAGRKVALPGQQGSIGLVLDDTGRDRRM